MNHIQHPHTTSMETEPPHLYGRWQRDPLMRVISGIRKTWFPLWGALDSFTTPDANDHLMNLEIVGREKVADDENVIALTFAATDRSVLPEWHPGAHLDLHLQSGRMRSYSLCGDPGDRTTYRVAVRRIPDGGGGSIEVHDTLKVGNRITIHSPRNAFPLALPGYGSPSRQLRFIAAGIGITPILPMLAMADRYGLNWSMLYSGRSLDSIPFTDELARYGNKVTIRTDDVDGYPTMEELVGNVELDDDGQAALSIYTCGPPPMLEALRAHLVGRPDIELHFERFAPPPVEDGTPFTIRLNSTGETIDVADDETALAAILKARPASPYSCRQGFCGACKLHTTSGDIDHRDGLLTEPERQAGFFLPCVSRCDSAELAVDA